MRAAGMVMPLSKQKPIPTGRTIRWKRLIGWGTAFTVYAIIDHTGVYAIIGDIVTMPYAAIIVATAAAPADKR